MRQCNDAIEAAATVARFGNPNAASDVGVALELLVAGGRSARLNVEINLASLDDEAVRPPRERDGFRAGYRGDDAARQAARAALQSVPREVGGSAVQCQLSTETVNGIGRL